MKKKFEIPVKQQKAGDEDEMDRPDGLYSFQSTSVSNGPRNVSVPPPPPVKNLNLPP